MKRPSPFVLIAMLLIAALLVVDNFLVKCIFFAALLIVGYVVVRRLSTLVSARAFRAFRRDRIAVVIGVLIGILAIVAFLAMLGTQPRVQATYQPDQFSKTNDIVEQRGFYRTETDAAQNQYVWTQERATIVFDFLVHKPITLTVSMRSAAVAGGPDIPVQVIVNGHEVGMLHPDPANPSFQPLSLRFVPYDWGGERTEIKLIPTTFKPRGDSRILGTMVQGISIDKSDAWSTIGRRMWLLWVLPVFALAMLGLTWIARRFQSSAAGYGAIGTSLLGGGCAVGIGILILRIGFIERDTYHAWVVGSAYLILCFAGAVILLPFGAPEATSLFSQCRLLIARYQIPTYIKPTYIKTRVAALTRPMALEPAPTRSAIRRDLVLIFVIALGVRLIWVTIMPPWQAPDEPEHYLYISYIVEQGQIPHPPYAAYPGYPQELLISWNLTLLGKLSSLGASADHQLPYLPIAYDYSAARNYQTPSVDRRSSGGGRAISYPPLYYLFDTLPYLLFKSSPILARLYAVRCGSAILGALSCVFGYLLAYELRRTRQWGWALGLCMAFLPMYVFMTAVVNNDAALNLAGAALIWLTVRIYRRDVFSVPLALGLGVTSGLALLTKQTIAPVVVVGGIVVLIKIIPSLRSVWRETRAKLLALAAYGGSVAAVYGPWVLFRLHYFGDLGLGVISLSPFVRFFTGGMPVGAASPLSVDRLSGSLSPQLSIATISLWRYLEITKDRGWIYFQDLLFTNFWGNFGWLDAPLPQRVFIPIVVVYIIGGIGVLIQLGLQHQRRGELFLLLAFLVAQVLFLFIGLDYFDGYVRSGAAIGLQGRYFFPVLAPLLFLLLSGWNHLCRENGLVLRLAPLGMACLQLIGLATILARYYGVTIG